MKKYLARLFGERVDIEHIVRGYSAIAYRWRGTLYVWRIKQDVIGDAIYDPKRFRQQR